MLDWVVVRRRPPRCGATDVVVVVAWPDADGRERQAALFAAPPAQTDGQPPFGHLTGPSPPASVPSGCERAGREWPAPRSLAGRFGRGARLLLSLFAPVRGSVSGAGWLGERGDSIRKPACPPQLGRSASMISLRSRRPSTLPALAGPWWRRTRTRPAVRARRPRPSVRRGRPADFPGSAAASQVERQASSLRPALLLSPLTQRAPSASYGSPACSPRSSADGQTFLSLSSCLLFLCFRPPPYCPRCARS
jgi:hypothetical protein